MKLKKISTIILAAVLTFAPVSASLTEEFAITAEAHSGRTDSSGGHKDNKNASGLGSYHYHCGGYPAHLHEGGVCPYTSASAASAASSDSAQTSAGVSASTGSDTSTDSAEKPQLSNGETITVSSDMIKIIQDVLKEKGYDCGSIDGVAGEKTKEMIKEFLENSDEDSTDNMIVRIIAEALGIE